MNLAIVGAGYTGTRLARACLREGADVLAMTRAPHRQAELNALGARCVALDLDGDGPWAAVSDIAGRDIFYMVPPADAGDRDPRMGRFLAALSAEPGCLVYLSTTAVYGDCGGERVDENSPTRPASDRGRRRLDAERQALDWG
ncbi:MAG: NAD-dependent epimerase/dehydratase family protein, partial [Gammaproteobacteria bacterium]